MVVWEVPQIPRHVRKGSRSAWMPVALVAMAWIAAACEGQTTEAEARPLEYDDSGQIGIATLIRIDSQTEIVLDIEPGQPEDDPQPAHIHFGSCGPNLGELHFFSTTLWQASRPP